MTKTNSLILVLSSVVTCCCFPTDQRPKTCSRGEFLVPDVGCQSCPLGFYNDRDMHTFPSCFPCTKPEALLHALEIQNCTRQHDTYIVKCMKSFYISTTYENRNECSPCHSDDCTSQPDCCSPNDSTVTVSRASGQSGPEGSSLPTVVTSSPWSDSTPGSEWNQTHPNDFRCEDVCVKSMGQVREQMVNMTCKRTEGSGTVLVRCQDCHTNISYNMALLPCPEEEKKMSPAITAVVVVVVVVVVILAVAVAAYCCLKKPYLNYIRANAAPDK